VLDSGSASARILRLKAAESLVRLSGGGDTVVSESSESIQAVKALSQAVRKLRELGVFRSRCFTGDLGEWYVATLYEGELPRNQTQKGWDVRLPPTGQRLQVRTQSFDPQNPWNYFEVNLALFDRLILVVLTDDFTIKALYDVPSAELKPPLLRVGKEQRPMFRFSDLEPWRTDVSCLPGFQRIAELVEPEACHGPKERPIGV
jgi:hypothetical protein